MKRLNVVGDQYGRLTVIEDVAAPTSGHNRYVRCRCACGNTTIVILDSLRGGKTRSCGCLLRETTSQRMKGCKRAPGAGRKCRPVVQRYRLLWQGKGKPRVHIHTMRATLALGRPLPPDAVVHHADGSTADDAPLVICPSETYHKELHRKMRVKAAGGNPWTDAICTTCRKPKPFADFYVAPSQCHGRTSVCKACSRHLGRCRRAKTTPQKCV